MISLAKWFFLLSLMLAVKVSAQSVIQSAIQGPKCTGVLYGIVYSPSGHPAIGAKVTAFPVGVDLGALLPDATADQNGGYRFQHICPGKYTVIPEDPKAGYPIYFADEFEFLYGTRMKTVGLNWLHRQAELPVHLPPKPGRVLLHVRDSQTNLEILKFSLKLNVPRQHRLPELTMEFDTFVGEREFNIPPGKDVILQVKAEGYKDASRMISVLPGTHENLDLRVGPAR